MYGYPGAGLNATAFSIVASTNATNNGITLRDGVPQTGSVTRGQWVYYNAFVNVAPGSSYSISITPSSGDPDL